MMTRKSARAEDVAFGARIRAARVAAGLSMEKLGRACGITFQQIQKYENGTNRVGYSRMVQIAAVCGVSVSDLVNPDGELAALSTSMPRLSLADYEAFGAYGRLDADRQGMVRHLIDWLGKVGPVMQEAAE